MGGTYKSEKWCWRMGGWMVEAIYGWQCRKVKKISLPIMLWKLSDQWWNLKLSDEMQQHWVAEFHVLSYVLRLVNWCQPFIFCHVKSWYNKSGLIWSNRGRRDIHLMPLCQFFWEQSSYRGQDSQFERVLWINCSSFQTFKPRTQFKNDLY